jgi:NTP pyrophosphatase (non-canonical NTP hydrolase)
MNWNEYLTCARRTQRREDGTMPPLNYLLVSLFGEVGELLNVVKKYVGHGHSQEWAMEHSEIECGDTFWYCVATSDKIGAELKQPGLLPAGVSVRKNYLLGHSLVLGEMTGQLSGFGHNVEWINVPKTKRNQVPGLLWGISTRAFAITSMIHETKTVEQGRALMKGVCNRNNQRLLKRFPSGFDPERSANREEYQSDEQTVGVEE